MILKILRRNLGSMPFNDGAAQRPKSNLNQIHDFGHKGVNTQRPT